MNSMYRSIHPYAIIAGLVSAILFLFILRHGVFALLGGLIVGMLVDMVFRSRRGE